MKGLPKIRTLETPVPSQLGFAKPSFLLTPAHERFAQKKIHTNPSSKEICSRKTSISARIRPREACLKLEPQNPLLQVNLGLQSLYFSSHLPKGKLPKRKTRTPPFQAKLGLEIPKCWKSPFFGSQKRRSDLYYLLAATRPKGFTAEPYLCAQLNAASSLPLHKDKKNFSRSWLLGLGSYEGGRLWIEGPLGSEPPPCALNSWHKSLLGDFIDIKDKWIQFDPQLYLCVEPVTGVRGDQLLCSPLEAGNVYPLTAWMNS